jgi:hypothetical protein
MATATGLPTNGAFVYVRLWWKVGGSWQPRDYTYIAAGGNANTACAEPGCITMPVPGARLTGPTETFFWTTADGVREFILQAGSQVGGIEHLYWRGEATKLTVTTLPTDGSTIHVRLYVQLADMSWSERDYTYVAADLRTAPRNAVNHVVPHLFEGEQT